MWGKQFLYCFLGDKIPVAIVNDSNLAGLDPFEQGLH